MASGPSFRLEDYSFPFPPELIAAAPVSPRDSARLLVADRAGGALSHRTFSDLPEFLQAGDCLVLNRTKVLPALLEGRKATGGKVVLLLVDRIDASRWRGLSTQLKAGKSVILPSGISAEAESRTADGGWVVRFPPGTDVADLMRRHGQAPLPPYIRKRRRETPVLGLGLEDRERYQTVYAREEGSIAAPTAGLHFTPGLLDLLREKGVCVVEIILHVGLGTFLPVETADIRDHRMLPETYEVPPAAAAQIAQTKAAGRRVVAVGTTATRTLESMESAVSGATGLFILPGHTFRVVDALLTNFHQPASTPLFLASAFAGRELILRAYREAIDRRYRLFSYGDSMLIL